jgi:hypothetical protein
MLYEKPTLRLPSDVENDLRKLEAKKWRPNIDDRGELASNAVVLYATLYT